jgi:hypothetical protein
MRYLNLILVVVRNVVKAFVERIRSIFTPMFCAEAITKNIILKNWFLCYNIPSGVIY